jgi:hypothetical protein
LGSKRSGAERSRACPRFAQDLILTPRASRPLAEAVFNLVVLVSARCRRLDLPEHKQHVYGKLTHEKARELWQLSIDKLHEVAVRAKRAV